MRGSYLHLISNTALHVTFLSKGVIVRENFFSIKRHFETGHENVLSVMYVMYPAKDIKSSYFRKITAGNWCNVLWLMVEDATTKSYFA